MKKLFASKNMIVKIALILAIILLIEFCLTRPVQAKDPASIGGTLLEPMIKLIVVLADGTIALVQNALLGMEDSFTTVQLKESFGSMIKKFMLNGLGAAVVAVAALIMFIFPEPCSTALGTAILSKVIGVGIASQLAIYGYRLVTGKSIGEAAFGDEFVIPEIIVSPESILRGAFAFFDVNFTDDTTTEETSSGAVSSSTEAELTVDDVHTWTRLSGTQNISGSSETDVWDILETQEGILSSSKSLIKTFSELDSTGRS